MSTILVTGGNALIKYCESNNLQYKILEYDELNNMVNKKFGKTISLLRKEYKGIKENE